MILFRKKIRLFLKLFFIIITIFIQDSQTHRTLTLISKTIQSLCNLVTSKSTSCKEQYMSSMYEAFNTDTHIAAVRQVNFIILSLPDSMIVFLIFFL